MAAAPNAEPPIYQALGALLLRATRPSPHPSDKVVHGMRRDMKRIRAALRLLRACLGEDSYHGSNTRVRDAAKPLATVRDAAVLLSSARRLSLHKCSASERGYLNELIPQLELERRSAKRCLTTAALTRRAAVLSSVQQYLAPRRTPSCDLEAVRDGIRKTYKAARTAWRQARRQPDDAGLHEWRKQVKYLGNQLDLIQEAFHIDGGKLHRHALQLGDCLGKDRDLALFTAKMDAIRMAKGVSGKDEGHKGHQRLIRRLRQARNRLQQKAWRRGKKVFSRSPRRFVQQLVP